MTVRIDWSHIKEIESATVPDVADFVLVAMPAGGRGILLSLQDVIQWQATYRTEGYDYADWDYLQSVVASTIDGLIGGVPVYLIVEQLTRIADALEDSETGEGIGEISGLLALLDPRLALLVQVLDGVENVLGGTFELPEEIE